MFPSDGPLARSGYRKHMQFMAAGARFPERAFVAANRSGKSETGAYELALHLTGEYPSWWRGKRFNGPIDAWAGGINNVTTRDVIQEKMLGREGERGTGMLPAASIIHCTTKPGIPAAVDTVYVKHKYGGRSILQFKSYEQGREAWQGTAKHVVWMDEEPDLPVYVEALMRTATTDGIMMLTFTPLLGMSDVVKSFVEADEETSKVKFLVHATWDDAPHLTPAAKASLLASIPPYQRDARTKGIPQLGAGAIYPLAESDIVCDRFDIPRHWRRAYGMDVGWRRTAAVWGAENPDTGIIYLWNEYYRSQAEPSIHAAGIRAPGTWIPGVIDPACLGSSQIDGRQLMDVYTGLGLDLTAADNAVEAGIYDVWDRLSNGRLKVFRDLSNWLGEFRKYHRDEKGKLVKQDDHLMDATRYLIRSGIDRMAQPPVKREAEYAAYSYSEGGWMA